MLKSNLFHLKKTGQQTLPVANIRLLTHYQLKICDNSTCGMHVLLRVLFTHVISSFIDILRLDFSQKVEVSFDSFYRDAAALWPFRLQAVK